MSEVVVTPAVAVPCLFGIRLVRSPLRCPGVRLRQHSLSASGFGRRWASRDKCRLSDWQRCS